MDRWEELYDKMRRLDVERGEREAREAADRDERRLFEEWCAKVTDTVMQRVADVATERARELARRSGREMVVEYPCRDPIACEPDGPCMSFMSLKLGTSELQIYSYRGPGDLPFIHFVPIPPSAPPMGARPKQHRLMSVPGAFIARHADGSWELLRARTGEEPAEPIGVDELVYRAFELLIAGLRQPVAS